MGTERTYRRAISRRPVIPEIDVNAKAYYTLKWIALICMFIDHAGYIFCYQDTVTNLTLFYTFIACRFLGRLVFPLFAFELLESFYYTKKRGKHLRRYLYVALLAEIPFDYAIFHTVDLSYQNVCFTLFLAFVMLIMVEKVKNSAKKWTKILYVPAVVLPCAIAEFIHSDYGYFGIVIVFGMWLARHIFFEERRWLGYSTILGVYMYYKLSPEWGTVSSLMYFGIVVAMLLIFLYENRKLPVLRVNRFVRFLGTSFYPIHFIILFWMWKFG